ncbi:MAG: class II glutamine amidotransferase [Pseudomonadota bacterium]
MCRLVGYAGPEIALERIVTAPAHSLLRQSQAAVEAKLAVNGDGFGLAWYSGNGATPGLYRGVMPAWSDANLASLARVIRSGHFIAHVRASTTGAVSQANCHPFVHGRWSFAHNGQIADFPAIRRALDAALPDRFHALRQGTTDSELLFLTLLDCGLEGDPHAAIPATIARITALQGGAAPNRLTCLLSDGDRIIGFRQSGDGRAPTLYLSNGPLDAGGRALASEPLDGIAANWIALAEDALVTLDAAGAVIGSIAAPPYRQSTSPRKIYPAP